MDETRNLWKGNFDSKRDGAIFNSSGQGTEEEMLTAMKVRKELAAAVSKHGKVTPFTAFE